MCQDQVKYSLDILVELRGTFYVRRSKGLGCPFGVLVGDSAVGGKVTAETAHEDVLLHVNVFLKLCQIFTDFRHFEEGSFLSDVEADQTGVNAFVHIISNEPVANILDLKIDFPILNALTVQHEHQLMVRIHDGLMIDLQEDFCIHESGNQGRLTALSRAQKHTVVLGPQLCLTQGRVMTAHAVRVITPILIIVVVTISIPHFEHCVFLL